jgi:hypothetical protein
MVASKWFVSLNMFWGHVRQYQKIINPTTEEGNSPQKFVQTKLHMISWEITLAINHFSYNH